VGFGAPLFMSIAAPIPVVIPIPLNFDTTRAHQ
jgi:hypothetical protein